MWYGVWCVVCCGVLCGVFCGGVCGVLCAVVCHVVCYVVYDELCGVLQCMVFFFFFLSCVLWCVRCIVGRDVFS